ncbi:MAG: molybdenum cofactor guanylyltransferase [Cyanobacteria bacterium]|nr:molybdenum cofactor guanylyltransferase [Cyanobacteria bacterium bin.51]
MAVSIRFCPCLLSGGESRRMGRDKALLPHPAGGTWLEQALRLLAQLQQPVTLLSRHPSHGTIAHQLQQREGLQLEVIVEPPPQEGPLLALTRLMAHHRGQRLLLAPVDMPWLQLDTLKQLLKAGAADPQRILVAHDGQRLQPLLGLYPASDRLRQSAETFTGQGGRSLLRWLNQTKSFSAVPLNPLQLRNANLPADWAP